VLIVRERGLWDEDRSGSRTSGEEVHAKSEMTQCANSPQFSEANANYCSPDLFPPSSPNIDSAYYTARVERKETPLTSRCPEEQQLCSEEKSEKRSEANAKVDQIQHSPSSRSKSAKTVKKGKTQERKVSVFATSSEDSVDENDSEWRSRSASARRTKSRSRQKPLAKRTCERRSPHSRKTGEDLC